MIFRFQWKILD